MEGLAQRSLMAGNSRCGSVLESRVHHYDEMIARDGSLVRKSLRSGVQQIDGQTR